MKTRRETTLEDIKNHRNEAPNSEVSSAIVERYRVGEGQPRLI